jgi:hypothetical protein
MKKNICWLLLSLAGTIEASAGIEIRPDQRTMGILVEAEAKYDSCKLPSVKVNTSWSADFNTITLTLSTERDPLTLVLRNEKISPECRAEIKDEYFPGSPYICPSRANISQFWPIPHHRPMRVVLEPSTEFEILDAVPLAAQTETSR